MEIYKGMSTFAGIAIGKIFYYNRAEYQLSQYLINNVKYELTRFEQAKDQVLKDLQHQLKMADQEEQKEDLQHQISVLSMGSFEKAVEEKFPDIDIDKSGKSQCSLCCDDYKRGIVSHLRQSGRSSCEGADPMCPSKC